MATAITPEVLPTNFFEGAEPELEERRMKVIEMRLMKYSQIQIAKALGVDQATVSRDMQWVAARREYLFGSPAKLKVQEQIGETVDFYRAVEARAMRGALKSDEAKAQNAYLRTAVLARVQLISLLQDLGFIERNLGQVGVTLRADAVRQALRDEGLLVGQNATTGDDDIGRDEVELWLRTAE